MADDLPGELPQLGARLDSQVVDEHPARPLVGLERLCLTAGPVEGDHQLRDEALGVRVLFDEPAQLAHEIRMAPKSEIRADPNLQSSHAKFLEARGVRAALRVQRHTGKHGAAPETEGVSRQGGGAAVVTGARGLRGPLHELLEGPRVKARFAEAGATQGSCLQERSVKWLRCR